MKISNFFFVTGFLPLLITACGAYSDIPPIYPEAAPLATEPAPPPPVKPVAPPIRPPLKPAGPSFDMTSWAELIGDYKLLSFDGVETKLFPVDINYNTSTFYYPGTQEPIKMLRFNIFEHVDDVNGTRFAFGPIDDLGTSRVFSVNGVKYFSYSYIGPFTEISDGSETTISFRMQASKQGDFLYVSFQYETTKNPVRISHHMKLMKVIR